MSNESKQPVKRLKDQFLQVSIWENEGSKGKFYNFTLSRVYKDGDERKYTQNFGSNDALALSRLIEQAYAEIRDMEEADYQASKQDAQAAAPVA